MHFFDKNYILFFLLNVNTYIAITLTSVTAKMLGKTMSATTQVLPASSPPGAVDVAIGSMIVK